MLPHNLFCHMKEGMGNFTHLSIYLKKPPAFSLPSYKILERKEEKER